MTAILANFDLAARCAFFGELRASLPSLAAETDETLTSALNSAYASGLASNAAHITMRAVYEDNNQMYESQIFVVDHNKSAMELAVCEVLNIRWLDGNDVSEQETYNVHTGAIIGFDLVPFKDAFNLVEEHLKSMESNPVLLALLTSVSTLRDCSLDFDGSLIEFDGPGTAAADFAGTGLSTLELSDHLESMGHAHHLEAYPADNAEPSKLTVSLFQVAYAIHQFGYAV